MFSTTTIASSTRMPIEKISAKQRDAVQRVAVQVKHGQGQAQRHRNRNEDDQRLSHAQHQRNQQADRDDRNQHVKQQVVRFLRRRFAVVPRDVEVDVRGKTVPFNFSTRASTRSLMSIALVPLRFDTAIVTAGRNSRVPGRTVLTYCVGSSPVSSTSATSRRKHRPIVGGADDHVSNVLDGAQEVPGFERVFAIVCAELAGRELTVRNIQRMRHGKRGQLMTPPVSPASSLIRISRRWPPISSTADTSGTCLIASWTCAAIRRSSKSPYRLLDSVSARIGTSSIKCGLTIGWLAPGRNQIEVPLQLLIEPHQALFLVLTHVETHDGQ